MAEDIPLDKLFKIGPKGMFYIRMGVSFLTTFIATLTGAITQSWQMPSQTVWLVATLSGFGSVLLIIGASFSAPPK